MVSLPPPVRHSSPLNCVALLAAALSLAAAVGCGDEDGEPASPLGEALAYLPADAPLAVAVSTDLDSDQYRAASSILDRFPVGAQAKEELKSEIEGEEDVDFDADVRPLLGNDVVVGAPDAESLSADSASLILAGRVGDIEKARELLERDPQTREVGEASGATIYEDESGDATALDEDVVVAADSREKLEQALATHDGADHLSESRFDDGLDDLPAEALVRVYGDMQSLLGTSPETERAKAVPWVGALRTLGATASATEGGVEIDFDVGTDPAELTDEDLPVASGSDAPPVVAREGEAGIGVRDPSQVVDFAERAGDAADPEGFGQLEAARSQLERQLGVNLDRDVIQQFTGDASVSVGPDGSFGFRSELQDAKEFQATLDRLARELPDAARGFGLGPIGVARPGGGEDLYAVATARRGRVVLGVVDGVFVLGQDPEQASELAASPPEEVPDAEGSITMSVDTQLLAERLAREELGGLEGLGTGLFTGPLGDLSGSIEAETDGLRGHLELAIE